MNKKHHIIFFGGVGSSDQFGGELTKNKEIIARLQELGCRVDVIDSYNARRTVGKLINVLIVFFWKYLISFKATFIFSTSFVNVYPIVKTIHFLPIKRNVVHWVIGGSLPNRIRNGIFKSKYLDKICLHIVEGRKMKKQMVDLGFNNVCYVPNFKTIGELPHIRKMNDGKIHFMFLSRIIPEKGCRYILESIKVLNSNNKVDSFCVDFFGNIDDSYREEFEHEVCQIKNVKYCGPLLLNHIAGYEIMAQYHYMLFPTFWMGEGFPGVIIDAYKAGVPIIASDWSLNTEFVQEGKTGVLIPTHNVNALTEAMLCAIQKKYDNDSLSSNCQKETEKYDTKYIINNNFLEVIINPKTRGQIPGEYKNHVK